MTDRLQLRPTPEQYQAFGDYLCEAHSWYKHLPLLEGRRFIVFVAADAGSGRLVARLHGDRPEAAGGYSLEAPPEGPDFTDAHPRLHYGWKTTSEYRTRFGYLDYSCWQNPDGSHERDAGPPVHLPAALEARCGFVLYPYVSGTFPESLTWDVHAEALAELLTGAPHPECDNVLELARLAAALEAADDSLSESEREWVYGHGIEGEVPWPGGPSAALRAYLELDDRHNAVARLLRDREAEKIRTALRALDDWLAADDSAATRSGGGP